MKHEELKERIERVREAVVEIREALDSISLECWEAQERWEETHECRLSIPDEALSIIKGQAQDIEEAGQ